MGIGTLIIFIALLLVASIAAAVLIQTVGSLQESALTTGDQAQDQIATNIQVTEVSATDGGDGTVEFLEEIAMLSPGSTSINLDQILLTVNTYDYTATLIYRGTLGTADNDYTDGYYTLALETLGGTVNTTPSDLEEDYDIDGVVDQVMISNGFLHFVFSSGENYTMPGVNCSGVDATVTTSVVAVSNIVESIIIVGDCGNDQINTTAAEVIVTPKDIGEGFFTVDYLQHGTNPVDGTLQTGDVIKIYYEAPRAIAEDEEVRINFIPKIGTPTLTQFITPQVMSTERVYLYP